MKIRYVYDFLLFVVLILLQVLLFNNIHLFGIATPVFYIYFLIKLPLGRNPFFVIVPAFLMGLIIDIFMNTPGMNAAATTIVATFRKPILSLFFPREEYEDFVPSLYVAAGPFIRFSFFFVTLHQTLLFFIESFTFFNVINTLSRIAASSILTLILIFAIDSLIFNRRKSEQ